MAVALAKQHYIDYGYKEGRSIVVPDWDEIWYCGDAPDSSCECHGTLFYGEIERADNYELIETLDAMREWKHWKKKSYGDEFLYCDSIEFNADHYPAIPMQCFCEPLI